MTSPVTSTRVATDGADVLAGLRPIGFVNIGRRVRTNRALTVIPSAATAFAMEAVIAFMAALHAE